MSSVTSVEILKSSKQLSNHPSEWGFSISSVNGKIEFHRLHNYVYGGFIASAATSSAIATAAAPWKMQIFLEHKQAKYTQITR